MESDILDILDQVGYEGPLSEEACLLAECGRGFSSSEYVNLLTWLTERLTHFTETHEEIITADPERSALDVSRLLKDLCCPYEGLASRLMNGDVKDMRDHLKIILFLASELQAAQIQLSKAARDADVEEMDSSLQDLSVICETLKLEDPARRDAIDTLTDIQTQVSVLLKQLPAGHVGDPALESSVSADGWRQLEKINGTLAAQYECRRRMLIKRLDVTVQSFSWSDRAKVKMDQMARAYQPKRYCLSVKASVSPAHLLAARRDICNMVKTSSGSCREKTSCAVNRILMGRVPDRGGRPSEIQAPPPEMPAWKKRSDGGGRGSGYGGGRGGYKGGWHSGGGDGWRSGRWNRGGQHYH